jgi:uncharacterized protein YdaU (DUF1376 family)
MHFYQFHIGDYISHTHHLSLLEDIAFRRLLDFYYLHESPIKQRDIARQIGMREYEQEVLTVLNEFFVSTEDGFIHPRADAEIAKFRKFSEDGKRGAAMRWQKGGDSPPNATPIATNNHKPITNNHIHTPDGVDNLVWQDFIQVRKKRRAPITDRVIEGLTEQARIAGVSLNDALKECVVRGWQSFKAEWVAPKASPADIARITVPGSQERDPALVKLDLDRQKAKPPSLEVLAKMAQLRKGA